MGRYLAAFATLLSGCGGGSASVDAPPVVDAPPNLVSECGLGAAPGWQRCNRNPLLQGTTPFVDGGTSWTLADPTVLYDPDEQLWKAWWSTLVYTDCATLVADHEIHIRYAQSVDGITWDVQAEPVLRSHRDPADWDDTVTETPTVLRVPDAPPDHRFAMIYAGGNNAALMVLGETGWQLGLAFSSDGRAFTRLPAAESPYAGQSTPFTNLEGLVLLARDAFPDLAPLGEGILADPELVRRGDTYHLFFSSAALAPDETTVKGYGISHATSTDLVHWVPSTGNPRTALIGGGQPAVIDDGSLFTMWFSQDSMADLAMIPSTLFPTLGFYCATSPDGLTWSPLASTRDFAWDRSPPEDLGLLNGSAVVRGPDGNLRLYYAAWSDVAAPADSCVFVQGQTAPVAGRQGLLLAVQREGAQ